MHSMERRVGKSPSFFPSDGPSGRGQIARWVALAALGAIALYAWSDAGVAPEDVQQCLHPSPDQARLACYDELAAQKQPAKGALAPAAAVAASGS
jgi:hypothetical protein